MWMLPSSQFRNTVFTHTNQLWPTSAIFTCLLKLSFQSNLAGESIQYYYWHPLLIDIIFTASIGRQLLLSKQKWLDSATLCVCVCVCVRLMIAFQYICQCDHSNWLHIGRSRTGCLCVCVCCHCFFLIIVPNQGESNAKRKAVACAFNDDFSVDICFTLCCKSLAALLLLTRLSLQNCCHSGSISTLASLLCALQLTVINKAKKSVTVTKVCFLGKENESHFKVVESVCDACRQLANWHFDMLSLVALTGRNNTVSWPVVD